MALYYRSIKSWNDQYFFLFNKHFLSFFPKIYKKDYDLHFDDQLFACALYLTSLEGSKTSKSNALCIINGLVIARVMNERAFSSPS